MRVLVLGGTNFIGPHVVQRLCERGHDVTVFNRGKTVASLPDSVTRLRGDRAEGRVAALSGGRYDATIDLCAYVPRVVDEVLDALDDPGFYCFVSSVSVYASTRTRGQDETAAVHELADPGVEEIRGNTYGGLKALCERRVMVRAASSAVLRLGLVVGPGDNTDRFTYWPVRTARGGPMLVPGSPDDPMQWIDVHDVARFAVRCIEHRTEGTFNVATSPGTRTLGELLKVAHRATSAVVEHVWLNSELVASLDLKPWTDFPAWIPPHSDDAGFVTFDNSSALAAGLELSSTEFTVKSLLDWWVEQPVDRRHLRAGIDEETERRILTQIRAK